MHDKDALLGQKIDQLTEIVNSLQENVGLLTETLSPELMAKLKALVEAYDGVIFGRKVLTGLAMIIGSIAAIGAAGIGLLNWVRHG